MIIEPRMRGFICLTAHPDGAAQNVKNQIAYIKSKGPIAGAKKDALITALVACENNAIDARVTAGK